MGITRDRITSVVALMLWHAAENVLSDGLIYRTTSSVDPDRISDLYKRTPDFIEANGFVAETHSVTTEDGYVITLHRIPGEKIGFENPIGQSKKRPLAILQHGAAGASDNWVLSGLNSFPFVMANAGFDVWLPDSRGNCYSKKHVNLTADSHKYWDFSFHEMAYYDLASTIDYALAETGQKKAFLIGHSRGTTMGFILLATRPEYNKKINLFVAFAPVAYMKHCKSPTLQTFFDNSTPKDVKRFLKEANLVSFPGKTDYSMQMRTLLCRNGAATQPLCTRMLFLFNGFDYDLMNNTMVPIIISHFPDGGSVNEIMHYYQIAKTDEFKQFDYGKTENLRRYGRSKPPDYILDNISAPISLHYADNDYFVSAQDLQHLASGLKSAVGAFRVPFKKFNHIDFEWGTKANELVYQPTVKLMKKYL